MYYGENEENIYTEKLSIITIKIEINDFSMILQKKSAGKIGGEIQLSYKIMNFNENGENCIFAEFLMSLTSLESDKKCS